MLYSAECNDTLTAQPEIPGQPFYNATNPGGYLLIGHSESINNLPPPITILNRNLSEALEEHMNIKVIAIGASTGGTEAILDI